MTEYSPGMRVLIRGEEWKIKKVEHNTLGNPTLHCVGISALVKDKSVVFLTDLEEITIVDPRAVRLVADASPRFASGKIYIESQWRQQIPTDADIHIGDRGAMNLMHYQLEPAAKALKHLKQRILIADGVGLGKTLEAGVLMSELIVRGKGKRILVVTVKSMMMQFQKEMWNRFSIPLIRLDSAKMQKIRSEIPANYNPFFYYDKTIISVDTLKRDIEYRTHLENAEWDIIVIDEAHNVAKRGKGASQRSKLAELLAQKSDTLIMLSATPHDGSPESFASLMRMLDETVIPDEHHYSKEDIGDLCIRRFKKDINAETRDVFQERAVTLETCQASAAEEKAFRVFTEMTLDMDASVNRNTSRLFKTVLEKSLFSSPQACIKTIAERIKRLEKKHDRDFPDIARLSALQTALEAIGPQDFSRYKKLLSLLRDPAYHWQQDQNDRVVIFTERIETMRFLEKQLTADLHLDPENIQVMHGGMTDKIQQEIVDEFGRLESPVRILVASDVASEGINLHYLSHRLIHFDIPWSLMVSQQRNGRIDRYGQTEKPDIRYLTIFSQNEKINGDARTLEILVKKEVQANQNIGDPTLLMGKFNIAEEEDVTMQAIENHVTAEGFDAMLDPEKAEKKFDVLAFLMNAAQKKGASQVKTQHDRTLFKDMDYLQGAMNIFSRTERYPVMPLQYHEGIDLTLTPELKGRLNTVLPDEVKPAGETLRLSPDKNYCMEEMARSLNNPLADAAWPQTQYLWKLHPIFDWINDKAGLLYQRDEAPVLGIQGLMDPAESIFIISGVIPNRKATPVVDEWFGLAYQKGQFHQVLTMEEVLAAGGLRRNDLPNTQSLTEEKRSELSRLLPDVIDQAEKVMGQSSTDYRRHIDPMIDAEIDKLADLEERHKAAIEQLAIFDSKKVRRVRQVDERFETLREWVHDTLEIENQPYLRVIAVLTGVE